MTKKQIIDKLVELGVEVNEKLSATELSQILEIELSKNIETNQDTGNETNQDITETLNEDKAVRIIEQIIDKSEAKVVKINTKGIIQIGNQFKVDNKIFNSVAEAIEYNSNK